jgi:hypothetical protein
VLLAGAIAILGCLAFVCFFWASGSGNLLWRHIVLTGWTTRSITIASLLLRWVVCAQAAVCTSMLAAILLQNFEVPLPHAAAVSIMRFENTGPQSLSQLLILTRLRQKGLLVGVIALLMATTTLLLQFTSTALLSDVKPGRIPSTSEVLNLTFGISDDQYSSNPETTHYWSTKPAIYPVFAEYTEDAHVADGIRDTGVSLRAFLPIELKDSRDRVKSYSGTATVIDTRVVCMRPHLENAFIPPHAPEADTGEFYIQGLVGTHFTAPRFIRTNSDGPSLSPFNCSMAIQGQTWRNAATDFPMAICPIDIRDSGIVSVMEPLILSPDPIFAPGQAYLLINTTGTIDDWGNVSFYRNWMAPRSYELNGEWLIMHTNATADIGISFTLCRSAFEAQELTVKATRDVVNYTEATIGWHNSTKAFETHSIRQQLGATTPRQPFINRGTFHLAPRSWEFPQETVNPDGSFNVISIPTDPSYALLAIRELEYNYSMLMCRWCQSNFATGLRINREQSAVFTDIMRDTNDPALALQAQFTTLFGMSYYDHVYQFDYSAPAIIVSYVDVLKPDGWRLFYAVIVAAAHLTLVFLVTALFASGGKFSLLNNAWSVVAQLQGAEMESWVESADLVKDKAVKRRMKNAGMDKVLVGVDSVEGMIQVVRKEL